MKDVRAAVAWFDSQRDQRLRLATVDHIAPAYARLDWRGALDWQSRLSGDERAHVSTWIALAMVKDDPVRAGRLILEQGNSDAQTQFVLEWSQLDPAACVDWIEANTDSAPAVASMIPTVLSFWFEQDREAALAYLDQMDAGPDYDNAAQIAIHSLADDPAASKRVYDKIGNADIKKSLADALPE